MLEALHSVYHDRESPERGNPPCGGSPGGLPSPPKGKGASETLHEPPDVAQGAGSGEPEGLISTRRQLLSHDVEVRRRELLVDQRNGWGIRHAASEIATILLAVQADQLLLGGCFATLTDVQLALGRARRRARYAMRRVRSLSRDLSPRAVLCGQRTRYVKCKCREGEPLAIPEGCHQRLICDACRLDASNRTRKRLLDALAGHRARWRDERNRVGSLRMLTLTIAHSGDLARDRAEVYRGWMALRKAMHRWWARLGHGPLPFCCVWEWTAGEDGLGHVHAHVLVVGGPRWWDYRAINRVWRKACPRSNHIHIAWVRKQSDKSAANYVAKYVAKGTAIDDSMSDEVQAQTLAASYGKRSLSTSLSFWAPPCKTCRDCGQRFRPTQPQHHRYRWAAKLACRRVLVHDPSIADMLSALGAVPFTEGADR